MVFVNYKLSLSFLGLKIIQHNKKQFKWVCVMSSAFKVYCWYNVG